MLFFKSYYNTKHLILLKSLPSQLLEACSLSLQKITQPLPSQTPCSALLCSAHSSPHLPRMVALAFSFSSDMGCFMANFLFLWELLYDLKRNKNMNFFTRMSTFPCSSYFFPWANIGTYKIAALHLSVQAPFPQPTFSRKDQLCLHLQFPRLAQWKQVLNVPPLEY